MGRIARRACATRIVQDMKAQYGDDYGRVIKLYFEQIAENSGKK